MNLLILCLNFSVKSDSISSNSKESKERIEEQVGLSARDVEKNYNPPISMNNIYDFLKKGEKVSIPTKGMINLPETITREVKEGQQEGVIYISEKYGVSRHNCFCGCGAGVVPPLNRWSHFEDMMDGKLNIVPSIGSFNLPCQSHYYIKNNRVDWL